MNQALARLKVTAAKVKVTLATLLACFPKYKDTLSNLQIGKSVTLKTGADKHQVTRTSQNEYTQEML